MNDVKLSDCLDTVQKQFVTYDGIYKSRSGFYMNTYENKRLGRVGQRYGSIRVEEDKKKKVEKLLDDFSYKMSVPLDVTQTTESQYSNNGVWSAERVVKVHRPIVDIYKQAAKDSPKTGTVVLMMGAPGSGKGFILNKLIEKGKINNRLVRANPDAVKKYGLKTDYSKYSQKAAQSTHEESSHITKEVIKGIENIGVDYIQDKTFIEYNNLMKEISRLREKGLKVKIFATKSDPKDDYRRAVERAAKTGRETARMDEDYFRMNHAQMEETFSRLINNLPKGVTVERYKEVDGDVYLVSNKSRNEE